MCECSRCEYVLVFPWDQRGLLLLGVPTLLVGNVYHVKNGGCLLEVFIMRLFNPALSIHVMEKIKDFLRGFNVSLNFLKFLIYICCVHLD